MSRDPIGENGFDLVSNRPVSVEETWLREFGELLASIRAVNERVAQDLAALVQEITLQLAIGVPSPNLYAFLHNDAVADVDPLGLDGTKKDDKKDDKCCTDAEKKLAEAALDAAIRVAKKALPPQGKALLTLLQAAKTNLKQCTTDFGPCAEFAKDPVVEKCTECCLAVNPSPLAGAMCDKICIGMGFP